MNDKPKFLAKTTITTRNPVDHSLVASTSSLKSADIPTFDLSQNLNLQKLARDLEKSINSPTPGSCWFLWSGRRKIEKRQLDIEHQNQILEQIRILGLTAEEMAITQAKLFLMPEVVDHIINEHRREVKVAIKEFFARIHSIDKQMESEDVAVDKDRAEVEQIRASTRITNLQGDLLQKIIDDFNIDKITAEQAFVLVKALNPLASADVDFASQQLLVEQQLEKMKAETQVIREKAKQEKAQAKIDLVSADKTKRDYARLRNTTKGK